MSDVAAISMCITFSNVHCKPFCFIESCELTWGTCSLHHWTFNIDSDKKIHSTGIEIWTVPKCKKIRFITVPKLFQIADSLIPFHSDCTHPRKSMDGHQLCFIQIKIPQIYCKLKGFLWVVFNPGARCLELLRLLIA